MSLLFNKTSGLLNLLCSIRRLYINSLITETCKIRVIRYWHFGFLLQKEQVIMSIWWRYGHEMCIIRNLILSNLLSYFLYLYILMERPKVRRFVFILKLLVFFVSNELTGCMSYSSLGKNYGSSFIIKILFDKR